MLKNVSRLQLVAAWVGVVVVLFALSVMWGAPTSVGAAELWLLACLALLRRDLGELRPRHLEAALLLRGLEDGAGVDALRGGYERLASS